MSAFNERDPICGNNKGNNPKNPLERWSNSSSAPWQTRTGVHGPEHAVPSGGMEQTQRRSGTVVGTRSDGANGVVFSQEQSVSPLGHVRDAPAGRLPAQSHCCLQLLPFLREGSAGDDSNASSNCLKTFISKWAQTEIKLKISVVRPYEMWTLGNYLARNASLGIRLVSAKLPQGPSQCDDVPFFLWCPPSISKTKPPPSSSHPGLSCVIRFFSVIHPWQPTDFPSNLGQMMPMEISSPPHLTECPNSFAAQWKPKPRNICPSVASQKYTLWTTYT